MKFNQLRYQAARTKTYPGSPSLALLHRPPSGTPGLHPVLREF